MSSAIDPAARAQPTTWTTNAALRRDVPVRRGRRLEWHPGEITSGMTAPGGKTLGYTGTGSVLGSPLRVSFWDRVGHVGRLLCLGARGSRRSRRGSRQRRSWPPTGSRRLRRDVLARCPHGPGRCRRSRCCSLTCGRRRLGRECSLTGTCLGGAPPPNCTCAGTGAYRKRVWGGHAPLSEIRGPPGTSPSR